MGKTLEKKLKQIQAEHKTIVVPYIMAGDGGLSTLEEQLHFLEDAGVSAIEIGIPFSDPVADGPVIQAAGLRSLAAQTTLASIIENLQKSTVQVPLVIMSYFNPILNYGIEKFVSAIQESPVKGLIIPDLPFEHRNYIKPLLEDTDISLVSLLSLTSPKDRMKVIADESEGFIYAVTVNGTTGARIEFGDQINQHLAYLKTISPVPVLAGFGVSLREHVERFTQSCDGVIIGSKIVKMLAEKQNAELEEFLKDIVTIQTNEA